MRSGRTAFRVLAGGRSSRRVWTSPVVQTAAREARRSMVRVSRVVPGSVCDEMGIVPGTELLTVNGRELLDFLDWEFLTADDELVIEAKLPSGEEIVYEVERPEGGALGA